jgi:hypothetical protein
MPTAQEILERAYKIWEENNRPEGRDDEFWFQAVKELTEKEERGDPAK